MKPVDLLCSRNARSRTPSHGLMASPGKSIVKQSEGGAGEKYLPVGGWVRTLRAVEAPLACPQRRRQKSSGCSGGKNPRPFFHNCPLQILANTSISSLCPLIF